MLEKKSCHEDQTRSPWPLWSDWFLKIHDDFPCLGGRGILLSSDLSHAWVRPISVTPTITNQMRKALLWWILVFALSNLATQTLWFWLGSFCGDKLRTPENVLLFTGGKQWKETISLRAEHRTKKTFFLLENHTHEHTHTRKSYHMSTHTLQDEHSQTSHKLTSTHTLADSPKNLSLFRINIAVNFFCAIQTIPAHCSVLCLLSVGWWVIVWCHRRKKVQTCVINIALKQWEFVRLLLQIRWTVTKSLVQTMERALMVLLLENTPALVLRVTLEFTASQRQMSVIPTRVNTQQPLHWWPPLPHMWMHHWNIWYRLWGCGWVAMHLKGSRRTNSSMELRVIWEATETQATETQWPKCSDWNASTRFTN